MKSLAKYLLLISAALMLIPVAADAQRRGAKNKPKKTAYNSEEELAKAYPEHYAHLKDLGVQFVTGEGYLDHLLTADVVYRTPNIN